MNIQALKLELVKSILEIDSIELIQKVSDLVKKEQSDFWSELSDYDQKEIKEGINELNDGQKVSYESVIKKLKK